MSTYSKGCPGRVFVMPSAMIVALSMLGALAAAQVNRGNLCDSLG
jgi:hypothetical protein